MRPIIDIVKNYLIELRNAGITSFHKAEIVVYLKQIGIETKTADKKFKSFIERKEIISLKNGKFTFIPRRR